MNLPELLEELKRCKVFPMLDGDQLKLTGETENLSGTLIASVKAQKNAFIDFLKGAYQQLNEAPIVPISKQNYYPCTNAQKRIWLLTQMDGAQHAYNIVTGLYIKGHLDRTLLEKAFVKCLLAHESLRTVFRVIDGELCQSIIEHLPFSLEPADISACDNKTEKLQTALKNAAAFSFDLSAGPLLRATLTRVAANEFALVIAIHHIISDGWSMGVLINQVMQHYEWLCKGEDRELTALPVQYKDYTCWLQEQLAGERGKKAAGYWSKQFPHEIPVLSLPYDYQRPAVFNFEGAAGVFRIDAGLHTRIQDFCKTNKATLFNFLRAVISLMLHKYSGQPYVIVGFPVAGRNRHELQQQVGLYVNTLPLATEIVPGASFMEFFRTVEKNTQAAMEYQDYPFDRIIAHYSIKRDTSRHPLLDVMMVLQNSAIRSNGTAVGKFDGFDVHALSSYLYKEDHYTEVRPAKADLTFNFTYDPDLSFWLEIEYATSLFKPETILQFYNIFTLICNQVLDEAAIQLADISIVNESEKQALIHSYNQPVEDIHEWSITALLTRAFTNYSDEIALYAGDNSVTYRQVQAYADTVAANLTAITGGSSALIGLLMDRSEWTVITILGIWKAGLAYVPIDKKYPAERIDYIIRDAQLEYLIIDDDTPHTVPDSYSGKIIPIAALKKTAAAAPPIHNRDLRESIAYVIYTSGSTGKPKGVQVCHRNTIAFLLWAEKEFSQTAFDILYAATSYCFDLSVFEFFVPLLIGKPVRILASALDIPEAITTERQVFINTVPAVVRNLEQNNMDWSRVSALNIAGEPLTRNTIKHLNADSIEIRNLYGPTEDTTYSTVYRINDTSAPIIPIGKPVGYTHLYILDADKNLLPPGVPGEIYLSGQSIAKGYLGQPALTAERFCNNPFVPGLLMYRTGDQGKLLSDGNALFLQRLDDQVKIRGYRIEPGEIQAVIEQHPQVKQAIVKVLHNREGEPGLIAYWQAASIVEERTLKTWLSQKLPAYMLPDHWLQLASFPVTSNGKIDKERLPAPGWNEHQELAVQAPAGYFQETLYRCWQQLLNKQHFGIHQNFFDLGGNSLLVTRLKFLINERLNRHITLPELFSHTTIAAQASLLEQREAVNTEAIPPAATQTHYPISFAQEQLWVLTSFTNASVAYNMPAAMRMKGNWDIDILQQAFRSVIDRYEILRTVFTERQGEPVQQIKSCEEIEFTIETVQPIQHLTEKEEADFLKARWAQPFDLSKGPLISVFILQNGENNILSFNMHHLISDGWSIQILCREVIAAYQAIVAGKATTKTAPLIQYKDFASWQRHTSTGARVERDKQYWMNQLIDPSPALQLPTDHNRPEVKTYNGQTQVFQLEEKTLARFNKLLQANSCSLFIGLTALVNILMKKYADQNDITLGTLVSGRDHFQLENQIGFFVNTLAVRTHIDPNAPVTTLLANQKQVIHEAFEHQELPFEQVLSAINPPRDLSRSPLFDVLVVLQQEEETGDLLVTPGFQLQQLPLFNDIAKYDLTFEFRARHNSLQLEIQYNSDLFKANTITRMATHFSGILNQVVMHPQKVVKDITLIESHEHAILQQKADRIHVPYDKEASIISLFKQAVNRYPQKTALRVNEKELTYSELDKLSSQLAYVLVHTYQVGAESLVLLHFERNEWMLITIFAVLKAGGAYVPIDPAYPADRINYMIDDTKSEWLLYDKAPAYELIENNRKLQLLDVTSASYNEELTVYNVKPQQLAYVIYTSGTTGQPKGVMIEHRQVTRLLFNEEMPYDFNASDKWVLFHSYCFDVSVWEIFGSLLYGGSLAIIPKETIQNSMAFYDFLIREQITILNQTPTAFRSLVQNNHRRFTTEPVSTVRYLVFAGEALMPEILKEWRRHMPACRNINMYGITETTVHVTFKQITDEEIEKNISNVGIPLPTLSCRVLDKDLQQVPPGIIGELCVGGAGVARGYLNKPGLTQQRFVTDPFEPGERLYRSGDYARILPSGDIEYIGRKDDQVKIRGHRIELAEITSAINRIEGVNDAIVLPVKNANGEFELAAYYIAADNRIHVDLRSRLHATVPSYMVPSYLVALAEFPVNSNGKLDKTALPDPFRNTTASKTAVAARDEMDAALIAIWEAILEKNNIGIEENFFDLGGHSLKATRVISKIRERYGIRIDMQSFFLAPTIENLSNYLRSAISLQNMPEVVAGEEDELII
jgi:amino acid adenylation domain-containing protein